MDEIRIVILVCILFLFIVVVVMAFRGEGFGNMKNDRKKEYEDALDRVMREYSKEVVSTEKGGRGIIVCAGDFRNSEAYGSLSWIRNMEVEGGFGKLPIEWFYIGDEELNERTRDFIRKKLEPIEFYDCKKMYGNYRHLKGFPIKSFALMKSKFGEAIFLDSDSVSIRHPNYLFESEGYRERGNIFWRDYEHRGGITKETLPSWTREKYEKITGEPLPVYLEETESGQFLINRERYKDVIKIIWKLNELSGVFYKYGYGDKELFPVGFYLGGQVRNFNQVGYFPYAAKNKNGNQEAIMQRNPMDKNDIIFVHRTQLKIQCLSKTNPCRTMVDEGYVYMIEEEKEGDNVYYSANTMEKKAIPQSIFPALRYVSNAEKEYADFLAS